MSIRRSRRDNLAALAPRLTAVDNPTVPMPETGDELVFYTTHPTNPCLADFRCLRWGQTSGRRGGVFLGSYSGRERLAAELAPFIRRQLHDASKDTVGDALGAFRAWFRVFDKLEASGKLKRLTSACQLSPLHIVAGVDSGTITCKNFYTFLGIVNKCRSATGVSQLWANAPEQQKISRKLPPEKHIGRIWDALKAEWLATVDRWKLVDAAQGLRAATAEEWTSTFEPRLMRPSFELQTMDDVAAVMGYRTADDDEDFAQRLADLFPGPREIRSAFHLFVAGSRWNIQPVLDIPVDVSPDASWPLPTLQMLPGDNNKYLLTSIKNRGPSEPRLVGLWKTDREPGVILKKIAERTWPLRLLVLNRLEAAQSELARTKLRGAPEKHLRELWEKANDLQKVSRSAWLYLYRGEVKALTDANYSEHRSGAGSFLERVIDDINARLPADKKVEYMVPSDFRDAFARWGIKETGGSIFPLQADMVHRYANTTATVYLDNTAVSEENAVALLALSDAVFDDFAQGRQLDPTLLARICRDGAATDEDRKRLNDYRQLRQSRIGMGCIDPFHPPATVDPHFVADGVSQCTAHRCTLCLEHGRVTRQSMDGLAMRAEELLWLRGQMPLLRFVRGLYEKELANAEFHLLGFPAEEVQQRREHWRQLLESGQHRAPEGNGTYRIVEVADA
jgi:hypothetical protein